MFEIRLEKETLQEFLDALAEGRGVECPRDGGWQASDVSALAGACLCTLFLQGPHDFPDGRIPEGATKDRANAIAKKFRGEIHSAIHFFGEAAIRLVNGSYDDRFEPVAEAKLVHDSYEIAHITPVSGIKKKREK